MFNLVLILSSFLTKPLKWELLRDCLRNVHFIILKTIFLTFFCRKKNLVKFERTEINQFDSIHCDPLLTDFTN